ncbi:MAG: hypothetical protein R6X34_13700 [Chloroflexota bacterium]
MSQKTMGTQQSMSMGETAVFSPPRFLDPFTRIKRPFHCCQSRRHHPRRSALSY